MMRYFACADRDRHTAHICRYWPSLAAAAALLWAALAGLPAALAETPGKDGALTVTTANMVVNRYDTLAADAAAGSIAVTVNSIGALNPLGPGDLLMIYQAQGASIDTANARSYGAITSLNNAGRHEFVTVANVSGNVITLAAGCGLRYSYSATAGTQVIRVPQYSTLSVSGSGSIVASAWNGSTGGVVAIHVQNSAVLSSTGAINASARGFRGGSPGTTSASSGTGISTWRSTADSNGAEKGGSIAGSQTTYDGLGGRYARGAPANGGGGGNSHNAGGGGGANGNNGNAWNGQGVPDSSGGWANAWNLDPSLDAATNASGGGRGGYTYSSQNRDALTLAPGASDWGGNRRRERGGLGGRPLDNNAASSVARVFLGGGGGGGDSNNGTGGRGGNGGGLVYLIAGSVSGSGSILANGENGASTTGIGNDAPGGGGGGGTVVVKAGSLSGITIAADGGDGGSQMISSNEGEGPGGGGGGGYVAISGGSATQTADGGANGTTSSAAVTEFVPNGATRGGAGQINQPAPADAATPFCYTSTIAGTVFEDPNYGGGSGRPLATAGAARVANARLEIFDAGGRFITFASTDVNGVYSLQAAQGQSYTVRAVNNSVASTRTGGNACGANCLPVQTFRTNGLSGTLGTSDPDRVGGEAPQLVDAGNASTTLAALTTATTTAQSITPVVLGGSNVSGIDFGFNFSSIVRSADTTSCAANACQGTLRQFLLNANALGDKSALAQAGNRVDLTTGASVPLTGASETSIFMIPNGSAVPGLRAGLANQLAGGVALVQAVSTLPALTAANIIVDGGTQTANIGNSNAGTLGAGGSVGVDALPLSILQRPEVQVQDGAGLNVGLDLQASNLTVRGIALFGFGNAANADAHANLRIGNNTTGTLIEANAIGTPATSFADPGSSARSGGDNIRSVGGDNGVVRNNLIGFAAGKGFGIERNSNGWQVIGNEFRRNSIGNTNLDGVDIENGSGNATVQGNLFVNNVGVGVDSYQSSGGNTIINNTLTGNGYDLVTGAGSVETAGVRLFGTGNVVERNAISANYGAGVMVTSGSSGNRISRNSIFANGTVGTSASGQIGIDLLAAADNQSAGTAPYVTLNDFGDGDSGGNGLANFPVLQSATLVGNNLELAGFARPGALIELFIAAPDPSGFGEGQTYLVTVTEGTGEDLDTTIGIYAGAINGINQGIDITNRFRFKIPLTGLPSPVGVGTRLTATATLAGSTSEFSGNVVVGPSIAGIVYRDANNNGSREAGEDWSSGVLVYVNLIQGGSVIRSTAVNAGTGEYYFADVPAGSYTIIVASSATSNSPLAPAGWFLVSPTTGNLSVALGSGPALLYNFGLTTGSRIAGRVFRDDGAGGGTANDGVLNGGEQGIGNVTVVLTDCAATAYTSVTTAGDGSYGFDAPTGATGLCVTETNPPGHLSTGASVSTTALTSGAATDVGGTSYTYTRTAAPADTIAFTAVSGSAYLNLNFADVPVNSFSNDGELAAASGTTVYFPHVYTSGSGGSVTFTTSAVANPDIAGWGEVLFNDQGCNGQFDAGDAQISGPITLTAGQQVCILVKQFVPANAPVNAQNVVTVTASFTYSNANPALSAQQAHIDLTVVGDATESGLRLVKEVSPTGPTPPGATLTYTIRYINNGAAPLSNIVISDGTPPYTVYFGGSAGCPTVTVRTTCSVQSEPAANVAGAIRWTITGTLGSGSSGQVQYQVIIE